MPTLVAGHRYALNIFLYRSIDDFMNRAVVSHMNHLNGGILEYSAYNINGRVVTVKKRGCGNDPNMVFGLINFNIYIHAPSS
jgi:hypothetical protein